MTDETVVAFSLCVEGLVRLPLRIWRMTYGARTFDVDIDGDIQQRLSIAHVAVVYRI